MFTGSAVHLVWGALFTALLIFGCVTDIRSRRIPNELVLAILGTGWLFALYAPDIGRAFGASLAGTALGFSIWIVFYIAGAIGAGDVKFFAAAGAWLGPGPTLKASLIAAVVGGVLAVAMLLMEKRLGSALQRLTLTISSRSLRTLPDPSARQVTHRQLPYGVALAVGALAAAWLPKA
jgi:prepilin peptidase CpaA